MTEHRCWVTYEKDRALRARMSKGSYGEPGGAIPIQHFPPPPHGDFWRTLLRNWCRKNAIEISEDDLTSVARVKKHQIQDFLEYVYADDPYYFDPAKMLTWEGKAYLANSLNNLRAFVAQELNPRLWYELKADEF